MYRVLDMIYGPLVYESQGQWNPANCGKLYGGGDGDGNGSSKLGSSDLVPSPPSNYTNELYVIEGIQGI